MIHLAIPSLLLVATAAAGLDAPPLLVGVVDREQGAGIRRLDALDRWQGRRMAVVSIYTSWRDRREVQDELFRGRLPDIWRSGRVPMVTWEPFTELRTSRHVERRIAEGRYDRFAIAWARRMREFLSGEDGVLGTADDRRALLRLAPEMNGADAPWTARRGADPPEDYVRMWRRLHSFFARAGIDRSRLAWVWCVNVTDDGGVPAERFWPGEDVVDWMAVDGYDWGGVGRRVPHRQPGEIFAPMLARLRALSSRPIAIAETATSSRGGKYRKSGWAESLLLWAPRAGVRMVVWFDVDKEADWALFGGARGDERHRPGPGRGWRAYSGWRRGLAAVEVAEPDPARPGLLADELFLGLPVSRAPSGGVPSSR